MSQHVSDKPTQEAPAEEARRRSALMQQIIISVGSPVFSGWGPRIANVSEILRSLN